MLSVCWVPSSGCPSMKLQMSMHSGCHPCSKPHVQAVLATKAMAPLDTMQEADSPSEGASQLAKSPELLPVEEDVPLPEAPASPPQSANSIPERPQRPQDASTAHFQAATVGRADSSPAQPWTSQQHSYHTFQKVCLTQTMVTSSKKRLDNGDIPHCLSGSYSRQIVTRMTLIVSSDQSVYVGN